MQLPVKQLVSEIDLPYRHLESAGLDLVAAQDIWIKAGSVTVVPTGIAVQIPKGYYGQIQSRSGLAAQFGLQTIGGVIDYGYIGEIKVIFMNHDQRDYLMHKSERIAQLIIIKIANPKVKLVANLQPTARDCDGFGSSHGIAF